MLRNALRRAASCLPSPPSPAAPLALLHASAMRATTVLCVRKGNTVVMIGDGQVTQGAEVVKARACGARRLRRRAHARPARAVRSRT